VDRIALDGLRASGDLRRDVGAGEVELGDLATEVADLVDAQDTRQ
jgi:hypothetical protein